MTEHENAASAPDGVGITEAPRAADLEAPVSGELTVAEEEEIPAAVAGEIACDYEDREEDRIEDENENDEEPEGEGRVVAEAIDNLRDELAAATAEWRRGTRRNMDVMKEFGAALDAIGRLTRDVHTAVRQPAAAAPVAGGQLADDWLLALIDMADRNDRATAAFAAAPAPAGSWWPGARAALAAWRSAWEAQAGAFAIHRSHLESLLAKAGLQRIPVTDQPFDPACMTAVEAVPDSSVPDHTVLAELLPGWRHASGRILRSAQVRVCRRRA